MITEILRRYWENKAGQELQIIANQHKEVENKKIIDTIFVLASIGELTPERFEYFMRIISNQEIGDNDV